MTVVRARVTVYLCLCTGAYVSVGVRTYDCVCTLVCVCTYECVRVGTCRWVYVPVGVCCVCVPVYVSVGVCVYARVCP